MKCLPISNLKMNSTPSFGANLVVDKSVKSVIGMNKSTFLHAAEKCDEWLRNDMGHIDGTMIIRKNPARYPSVALEHTVRVTDYVYPFEETGYTHDVLRKEYEDLEFELNGKKCGFWLNKESKEDELLTYFKNMFNHLMKG